MSKYQGTSPTTEKSSPKLRECWSLKAAVLMPEQGCNYPPVSWYRYKQMNDHSTKSPSTSKFDHKSLLFLPGLSVLQEEKISFIIAKLSKQQVPIPLVATFSKLLFIKIHPTNLNNTMGCERLFLNSLPFLPNEVLSEQLCLPSPSWFSISSLVTSKPS